MFIDMDITLMIQRRHSNSRFIIQHPSKTTRSKTMRSYHPGFVSCHTPWFSLNSLPNTALQKHASVLKNTHPKTNSSHSLGSLVLVFFVIVKCCFLPNSFTGVQNSLVAQWVVPSGSCYRNHALIRHCLGQSLKSHGVRDNRGRSWFELPNYMSQFHNTSSANGAFYYVNE